MTSPAEKLTSEAVHAGEVVLRRVRSAIDRSSALAPGPARRPASGWLVVTVFRDPSEVDPGQLPVPLVELGDRIEVRVRPAPDGKGTELAARLSEVRSSGTALDRLSGSDPEADLRSALRRAKQLIEVGEVLAVDPAPHGKRSATPGGALLEAWTKVAPEGGVR
jgi:hypothetical protein